MTYILPLISLILLLLVILISIFLFKSIDRKFLLKQRSQKEIDYLADLFKTIPSEEVIFNVDTFNEWFCDPNNNAIYAHKGIFLRLDKFDQSQITDYLHKRWNIPDNGPFLWTKPTHEILYNFYEEIRKDWRNKKNKK